MTYDRNLTRHFSKWLASSSADRVILSPNILWEVQMLSQQKSVRLQIFFPNLLPLEKLTWLLLFFYSGTKLMGIFLKVEVMVELHRSWFYCRSTHHWSVLTWMAMAPHWSCHSNMLSLCLLPQPDWPSHTGWGLLSSWSDVERLERWSAQVQHGTQIPTGRPVGKWQESPHFLFLVTQWKVHKLLLEFTSWI